MIRWKSLLIAGGAGCACGQLYKLMKKHPETVNPILQYSAAAGVVGAAIGLGVAVHRDASRPAYMLSVGTNFAIVSCAFLGVRKAIEVPLERRVWYSGLDEGRRSYVLSGTSGAVTGALASCVSGNFIRSIAFLGFGGLAFGVCGQFLYHRMNKWRKRKAIEIHYPELIPNDPHRLTLALRWEKFLGFWQQYSQSSLKEMEVAMLEECIEEEKGKIEELKKLLDERGINWRSNLLPAPSVAQSVSSDGVERGGEGRSVALVVHR